MTARSEDGSRFPRGNKNSLGALCLLDVPALGRGDTPASFSRQLCLGAFYPEPSSALASLGSALGSRMDC